jgi:hypothetical protein
MLFNLFNKLMRRCGYVRIEEYNKVVFHRTNLQRLVHRYQNGTVKHTALLDQSLIDWN